MTAPARRRRQSHAPDGATQHRGWLGLVEISGPFLSLPVLRQAWPTLDPLERPTREALRREHAIWRDAPEAGQAAWVRWVLAGLLGWGDELRESADELDDLAMDVAEHETRVVPSFALVEPDEDVKPATTKVLGLVCPPGHSPTARVPGSPWAATYLDRVAALCRHQGVELGLVTDGRWWALVWAPKDTATGTAVFDAIAWPEAAERDVVRAFSSLLARSRFFGMRDAETLPALLHASLGSQEDITEALGSQVREAVELLVAALGREDLAARERGAPSLDGVDAHEVYRGAVSVMMRIVFLLFAEERRLLPADNDLYASTYSAGQLCAELERRALEGSEDDLEYTTVGWHRLLAVFTAVHGGIDHPRLTMHAHDGSLFDPDEYPWLDLPVDDRTVLHMLRAVQYVEIGTGRLKERRSLSFRSLGVEEIGYVYEGLLAYDAFRAAEVVVGLAGKRGQEPEIELRELEKIASGHTDLTALGGELSARFMNSGLGTAPAIAKKMRPLTGAAAEEARRKLLAATQGDAKLADRLTAFHGLLRHDLRELPMIIQPGALYVTDSPRRRDTGAHYTPRELAEEVVLHALEPLVYEPGPLQTADTSEWKLKSSEGILALNVADIAMGSAAFLVAAARYLGARLIEAWTREGDERAQAYAISDAQSEEDSVVIDARRQVIEHCLYGVDVNPMAVEMAKLSLWLVSMDTTRPFTFLDDRMIEGDSLLGITSLEQLEHMNLDPVNARSRRRDPDLFDWTAGVRSVAAEVAKERKYLVDLSVDGDPMKSLSEKRGRLYEAWARVALLQTVGDLVVGASVKSHDTSDPSSADPLLIEASRLAHSVMSEGVEAEARSTARGWLGSDLPDLVSERKPTHWPLLFPEVFTSGGFDAVIGNPPFLGGLKISNALGLAYKEHLVAEIANGVRGTRGTGDLAAYFLLRAHQLLSRTGQTGLVATNTVAQGDARVVGLDQIVAGEVEVRRTVKARPWKLSGPSLFFCTIWTSSSPISREAVRVADGTSVSFINSSLDGLSESSQLPFRLSSNHAIAFQGMNPLGSGFLLSETEARSWIKQDYKNREVLFPFVNGEDLNSRPQGEASRWAINFQDWNEARSSTYRLPFERVKERVRPGRAQNKVKSRRERWWQYSEYRRGLVEAIDGLDKVILIAQTSRTLVPAVSATGKIFSNAVIVFASDDYALFGQIASNVHYWWVRSQGSSLKTDLRYTPTDVFETFPLALALRDVREAGRRLAQAHTATSTSRNLGLTQLYNMVGEQSNTDSDIEEIRRLHVALDEDVIQAYGWTDRIGAVGGLDHGFHKIGRETRYTIGPAAQRKVLDSLLELNHERYAEEVAQGLHDQKKGGRVKKKPQEQEGMFDA